MHLLLWVVLLSCFGTGAWCDEDVGGPEFEIVTCGSAIKLQHVSTGYRLHSHEIKWGSGSHQQSVTAMDAMDDPNSLWVVKGAHGSHCAQGMPVLNGQTVRTKRVACIIYARAYKRIPYIHECIQVRLQHVKTKRNLHTHHFDSPLTKQHEVSAYGEDGEGDHLDDWMVETRGGAEWRRGANVRLKSRGTGSYLHSHAVRFDASNCGGNCPIMGQQEITAYHAADDENNWWASAEGVYFPVTQQ